MIQSTFWRLIVESRGHAACVYSMSVFLAPSFAYSPFLSLALSIHISLLCYLSMHRTIYDEVCIDSHITHHKCMDAIAHFQHARFVFFSLVSVM